MGTTVSARHGRHAGMAARSWGAIGALTLATVGVALVAPSPSGAVVNAPPNNPTAPAISYEIDCTTSFMAGVAAPFVTSLVGNTTTDSAAPSGVKFGFTGTASTTLVGGFIANIYAILGGTGTSQLQWTETIGSTDGHATGTYKVNTPTINAADGGGTTPSGLVHWTKGSTTLTGVAGDFTGAKPLDGLASGTAGIPQAATILTVSANASSITISLPTTAAGTAASVSWGANTVFSQKVTTGNVFTTNGPAGGTAGIGVVSALQFTADSLVTFGGALGDGPSNCLLTGWTGPPTPKAGPPQTGLPGGATGDKIPVLPAGSTTPLISVSPVTVQSAAYVNLNGKAAVPDAPTGVSATAGRTGGGYATVSWTAPATNGAPITSYAITAYQGGTVTGTPTYVGPVTSGSVVGLATGVPYTFTVAATNSVGTGAASSPSNAVTLAALPFTSPAGFRLITGNGGVFAQGDVQAYGSTASLRLNKPIVGAASTFDGKGYWLVASDGGIFSYGDAAFHGSTGAMHLNQPIVGMASTPDGKGYWLVASDGGIFAFGDAHFYGSMGAHPLNQPVVGMASSADGKGYWLVASDGGIFSFGDAGFHGSSGAVHLNKPIVGMASTGDGKGYWLVASDGGIFNYGDAPFDGSLGASHPAAPIVGMAPSSIGGYWLADTNGAVYALGTSYLGSSAGTPLTGQVIAIIS